MLTLRSRMTLWVPPTLETGRTAHGRGDEPPIRSPRFTGRNRGLYAQSLVLLALVCAGFVGAGIMAAVRPSVRIVVAAPAPHRIAHHQSQSHQGASAARPKRVTSKPAARLAVRR